MFGFQSQLLPVLFRIQEWIICCSRLIILPSLFAKLLKYEVKWLNKAEKLKSFYDCHGYIELFACKAFGGNYNAVIRNSRPRWLVKGSYLTTNKYPKNWPLPSSCWESTSFIQSKYCPMFGFQSHLLPVLFRIHEWIIFCSRLIILPSLFAKLLQYEVKKDLRRLSSWRLFTIAINILNCLLAEPWELLTIIIQYNSSI